MKKEYFTTPDDAPLPLEVKIGSRVKFEEVDILGIVWHGRYVSYFEEARRAFGDKYGLDYQFYRNMDIAAPIVKLHIDYMRPLLLDEEFQVKARLHWSEAAKLNFEFIITNDAMEEVSRGYSVQLFTERSGKTIILEPDWLKRFRELWRNGTFEKNGFRSWHT